MAVAAYASLLSLSHVLDNIQHPSRHHLLPNTKQIQTLHENVHFLQQFLELHSPTKIEGGIQDTMKQITEVANEAEEIIDSHVVDRLRQELEDKTDDDMGLSLLFSEDINIGADVVDELCEGSESTTDMGLISSTSFCQDIDKVIEKIDSIKEELLLTMVKAEGKAVQQQQPVSIVSVPACSSTLLPSRGNNSTSHVVGFDDHLVEIKKLLTGHQLNLQIIPIVGMGGIGKTTLARFVFEDKYVVEKFDKHVWFTISQEYSVHEILLSVLRDIGVPGDLRNKTLAELGLRLHQELSGRRYLIVMDDLWSTNGWDDFKFSFPNDVNGSRVMVTTRLNDVAVSLGSQNTYTMYFLDEDNSWNLLCEKAFTQRSCSPQLEDIGKKIARGCRGLPLAIVVIGGLLGKSNMTREYWEFMAENVISYANSETDEHCLKILALSYNHLPIHLKPCFLYMRVFPEDTEIRVSKLIKLWIAEGFLKPLGAKSLEEVAKEYLKDLIDRNLILIRKRGGTGEIKSCGIHDNLRDLCIRESQKEHFLFLSKVQEQNYFDSKNNCFLCFKAVAQGRIHLSQLHLDSGSTSLVSYFVCNACSIMYPQLVRLRMVRVGKEKDILQHTKLRYLSCSWIHSFASPSPMPLLWNLQSLITYCSNVLSIVLPSEIWEMPQLRHIIINHCLLPDPIVNEIEMKDLTILENLQTLSTIGNFKCTESVLERIPNLKKLGICYLHASKRVDWSYYSLYNLAHLRKLESLSLVCYGFVLETIAFPFSLKKLSLRGCEIPWKDMTIIGSLPKLEVLKLGYHAFKGFKWEPIEGQFLRLKFLSISDTNLEWWRADDIHFPSLETIKLRRMYSLMEIPRGIGDIGTLLLIQLVNCSYLIDSVKEILEEQRSFGNKDLQVQVFDRKGRRCCEWLDSI